MERMTVRPDQTDPVPDTSTTAQHVRAALEAFRPIEEQLTCGAPKIAAILIVEELRLVLNLLDQVNPNR